jgi:hypothetical protein
MITKDDEAAKLVASAMQVLTTLLDPDMMVELNDIMAEPDEPSARALLVDLQARFERQLVGSGISQEAAAGHAKLVTQRIGDAWTTLHQSQGEA